MIAVDRDIAMPPKALATFYPWESMNVGDSFLFPQFVNFPTETARAYSRRHYPKAFTARKTAEGWRCWRIA